MRGARSAGQDGHEGGAGAEHHVGLELAAIDGLGVGQHHDVRAELARRGDGRDAEAFSTGVPISMMSANAFICGSRARCSGLSKAICRSKAVLSVQSGR